MLVPFYLLIIFYWITPLLFAYALISLLPLELNVKNYVLCYAYILALSGIMADCIYISNKPYRSEEMLLKEYPKDWNTEIDIFEILNSFVNLFKSNQDERSDFQICEEILERENILWRSILAHKNGIKCLDKSQYITLSYEDLLKNAPDQIKKIYDFLGIKYYEHHFTNLNQLCINNIRYNDKALPLRFQNLHRIRTDKIIKNKIKSDLPKELIDICNEFEKEIIV